ncbi:hypothetical protein PG993_010231 [Apiospora rasikravindrae]|uniref:Uncharacterized protein n=1 Tax=Apiospora rasikravindrae TaxID=990691 RepID=A0ABR1SLM3_9PEZI
MPNMPQIPPNLSVQYIPNTGGCVIDIAAAINLAQFNIKVQEQYHVEVFPDRICVTLSLPPARTAASTPSSHDGSFALAWTPTSNPSVPNGSFALSTTAAACLTPH